MAPIAIGRTPGSRSEHSHASPALLPPAVSPLIIAKFLFDPASGIQITLCWLLPTPTDRCSSWPYNQLFRFAGLFLVIRRGGQDLRDQAGNAPPADPPRWADSARPGHGQMHRRCTPQLTTSRPGARGRGRHRMSERRARGHRDDAGHARRDRAIAPRRPSLSGQAHDSPSRGVHRGPGPGWRWLAPAQAACAASRLSRRCGNALAESVIGLYKTELIGLPGPWRSAEQDRHPRTRSTGSDTDCPTKPAVTSRQPGLRRPLPSEVHPRRGRPDNNLSLRTHRAIQS